MSDSEIKAIVVGKWSLGHHAKERLTILRFDFTDREPLIIAVPNEEADKIAVALIEQQKLRNRPLQKH